MTLPPSSAPSRGPVLIAGGGIGGLATALALARHGIASTVLERRHLYGEDGAGIQIGPNGTRILDSLGVGPFLATRAAVPDGLRIFDAATARPLATFPLGHWIAERHGAPYWVAHRRDLHSALISAAARQPLIEIKMGFEVAAARDGADTASAVSSEGDTCQGDVLIAADGVWSRLRDGAFSGAPLSPTGKCAVRAVLPMADVPEPLRRNDVHLWLGPRVHIVHYPVSAGEKMALVAIFEDGEIADGWNTACDASWVAARSAGFAPLLRDLLARPGQWRCWSLMELCGRPRFAAGRMALLGDAAHPILPFFAQGGVMALEDAVVVAGCLAADPRRPARALARYERLRKSRVQRVARASRMNGRIYHLDGLAAEARDFAFARIPPARFMRRFDWLYGWTAPRAIRAS